MNAWRQSSKRSLIGTFSWLQNRYFNSVIVNLATGSSGPSLVPYQSKLSNPTLPVNSEKHTLTVCHWYPAPSLQSASINPWRPGAMAGAVSLSQFLVFGSLSLPKRGTRSSVSVRATSETSPSTSASVSTTEDPKPDSPSSSFTFAPPPNFKPPEPQRFGVRPDQTNDVFGAALPLFLRFGTGVFASGYSFSFIPKDEFPPDQYALEVSGYKVKETAKLGPRPEKPIEIYEFESCPFCRKVREIVAVLDIDVLFYPCPRNGPNFRPKVAEMGGKQQFPYMVDPNTGVSMYESDDIIKYLVEKYGDGSVPLTLSLGLFTTLTAGLGMLGRRGKGSSYTPAKLPPEPLKLWAYEGSPFCKLVREVLIELELPHVQITCSRGSPKRQILLEKTGHFQLLDLFW